MAVWCIWTIESEGEFLLAEGFEGSVATVIASVPTTRDGATLARRTERLALLGSPSATWGTGAPPAGVRDDEEGATYQPDRVLPACWSWIVT